MRLIELPFADHIRRKLEPGARAYLTEDGCTIIVGREPKTNRWHLSIAHPARYPTWEEIKAARYKLIPLTITVAMLLPPPEEYINVHPNCFHLWELREEF